MKKEITGLTPDLIAKLRSCYIAERKALSAKLPINEVQWFSPFARRILADYANGKLIHINHLPEQKKGS